MKFKVKGENSFQVMKQSFAVSPSNEEYVLHYSADGMSFTAWEEATPANETLVVNGHPEGMFFKLIGNNTDVIIQG
jgi:hypothetical protein